MLATLQPAPGDGGESGLLFLSVPPLRKLPDVFWVEPLGAVRWCGGHEDRGYGDSGGWQQRQDRESEVRRRHQSVPLVYSES